MKLIAALAIVAVALLTSTSSHAETGARLWLRYERIADTTRLDVYRKAVTALMIDSSSPTGRVIGAELGSALAAELGAAVPTVKAVTADGALIVGTPAGGSAIAALGWTAELEQLGAEGYLIRSTRVAGHAATAIASKSEIGALYGVFHLLRLMQTGAAIERLDIAERPRLERRLLNHWDNLDGSIERGYAGQSLWWPDAGDAVNARVVAYARANASIGINGSVISSVNADPKVLTAPYLQRAAAIAGLLRPYGIRVYLSANASAPKMLGDLTTADPLDGSVARWWRQKADEIYARIPDFGGFVVKANSEGQPGPQDYGRTHADGANVLADALAPHGGIVMWRAFVYDAEVDPDRIKRAHREFAPLDGRFRENVFVQVKNGPLDFQPREPFHPLFGAMPKTPLMAELQITQEYLGHSNHLVYLAPMWKEFLDADTYARGAGSTVARVIDGSLEGKTRTGIAGVANTGTDANWTGHDFAQANWYAYGRLAWNPALSAEAIADEWIRMTWGDAPDLVGTIRSMLLDSREAFVRYTMPLGLHHLIGGDHYAPMPENPDPRRLDWSALYYHRADGSAIGFDRTRRGSGAVDQYFAPLRDRWNDPASTPAELLLWFHRLPWDYRLASGRTVWAELVRLYTLGAEQARDLERRWASLRGRVDDERFDAVLAKLRRQTADAAAWRDKCLSYFQGFSGRPLTGGDAAPHVDGSERIAPADRPVPRDDQNSLTAHAQLLDKAKQGRIDVFFVGDSIVRRWGATDYPELLANWTANFFGWNAANFGWGADKTQNILWRLEHGELDGVNPKVIVVLAGTNNVGNQPGADAKIADIVGGVKAILAACRRKAPKATIVLTAIFPRNDNMAVMPEIGRINRGIARLADGTRVRYLDVNDRLADADGVLREGMMHDRLHPTVKGYQVWADALKPILAELLGPPAAVDLAPPPTGDPSAKPR